ncbi:uncharacterized protein LOC125045297 [Penaeus chinensis]|uniref:uncharacterized protein LOC125045297 n=1 Tax=Penaeus chinensis TaxID=139456 RepID=UPI001FB6AC09|nr:uncharacterized protein LOC125045297 [Penaeus chinensis]
MIFSQRQLQEKCQEQQMPLYLAFIDLTKAFDMVSRSGLFQLLKKIGCSPHLLAVVTSFHYNMHSTVSYNSVTTPSRTAAKGFVCIHTRADGKLLNIARLRAKTKVIEVLIREMLFADDAALASHTEDGLQQLVSRFSAACKEFGLTISLKKTSIMVQGTDHPPTITIDGHVLEDVGNFTYLGSSISSSHTLETKPQQLCRNCTREFGTTPVLRKRPNCMSTKTVRSAASSTAAKHGPPTQGMRRNSTASTSDVYDAFFTSAGRTKSQTWRYYSEQA